jgi:uncharacterized protein
MCYEQPMRDAGNECGDAYDMDAMKAGLAAELLRADGTKAYDTARFTVFGGEPLLMPLDDLRELWRWGYEKFGVNGVQTNGTMVTDAHVAAFREFNVQPGISLDGPGELNDIRWAGTLEATRTQTARSEAALRRLLREGLCSGVIVTLHRGNASAERLPRLLAWLEELAGIGLRYVNLHLLESESDAVRAEWGLSSEENATALLACAALQDHTPLVIETVRDMARLLMGEDGEVSCIWGACDPYTTSAVRGVLGDGSRANCGRTNKDGVNWIKADTPSHIRQLALYQTPQEHGGCQGCRFFFACKGNCPGTAIDGDWRNRTEHCETLKTVFGHLERQLLRLGQKPISVDVPRRQLVEDRLLAAWSAGRNMSIAQALRGDTVSAADVPHGDTPHGDAPHSDHGDAIHPIVSHGDHTDVG